ncbi:hypothetical protein ACH4OY_31375 [Micromonospora rubida]|uniref:Uncharacterized protein n=1 Tax=Micromonospora rubida TaxID=2697657 RepID=A0ABW7STU9_9ACTN
MAAGVTDAHDASAAACRGAPCHCSSAWIGFYESSGLRCYGSAFGGGLAFAGQGDPYLACKHLTLDVVMAALRGPSDALICRVIR